MKLKVIKITEININHELSVVEVTNYLNNPAWPQPWQVNATFHKFLRNGFSCKSLQYLDSPSFLRLIFVVIFPATTQAAISCESALPQNMHVPMALKDMPQKQYSGVLHCCGMYVSLHFL